MPPVKMRFRCRLRGVPGPQLLTVWHDPVQRQDSVYTGYSDPHQPTSTQVRPGLLQLLPLLRPTLQ